MTDATNHHPDKTPVFGLDELEGASTDRRLAAAAPAQASRASEAAKSAGPDLVLRDRLSGVHLATNQYPIEIGNGRRFEMALKGPGPDGLYARIENREGRLEIELCHQRLFMSLDLEEASHHVIDAPAALQLGDHQIDISFPTEPIAAALPRKKRPKLLLVLVVAGVVIGATVLRFLLAADEAESRVTIVNPTEQTRASASLRMPAPDDSLATAQQPARPPSAVQGSGQKAAAPEPAEQITAKPSALPLFFAMTPPLIASGVKTADAVVKPDRDTPAQAPRPTPSRATAKSGTGEKNGAQPLDLKKATMAIRAFNTSETLDDRIAAWGLLEAATETSGNDAVAVEKARIRSALGTALLEAAKAEQDARNDRAAYTYYARAASMGRYDSSGRTLMRSLDAEAARLYQFGYQLRYSDSGTAQQYWGQVLKRVPSQSEWHHKAQTALNNNKGVRG